MRIAICDDEALFRSKLLESVRQYALQRQIPNVTITSFDSGSQLLENIRRTGDFDIYFLDIIMENLNGIELGLCIREAGSEGKIIYLTSSAEYALDSYKVKAFDYLLKPIDPDALFSALDLIFSSLPREEEKSILVKTRQGSIRVPVSDILYAELSHRIIIFHLTNGSIVESTSIRSAFQEALQELLSDNRFVLCGASMVSNLYHITKVENEAVIFLNTYKTYLGKKACRELRAAWANF